MILYISMKVHENILNGFQDRQQTQFCDRPMDGQMDRQELWFLLSVCHLRMLYLSMKIHENILNCFQDIEQTRNDHCQISTGNNSKKVLTRVMVLVVCM